MMAVVVVVVVELVLLLEDPGNMEVKMVDDDDYLG